MYTSLIISAFVLINLGIKLTRDPGYVMGFFHMDDDAFWELRWAHAKASCEGMFKAPEDLPVQVFIRIIHGSIIFCELTLLIAGIIYCHPIVPIIHGTVLVLGFPVVKGTMQYQMGYAGAIDKMNKEKKK